MTDGDMGFLNARRAVRGDIERQISHGGNRPSVFPRQGQRDKPHLFGRFQPLEHIGRIAAGADSPGHIARLSQRPDLFGKYFRKIVIVADAGDDGRVRRQSNGRQRRPLDDKAVDEFRGDMLSVRGRAPVAENEDFIARFQGCGQGLNNIDQFAQMVIEKSLFDPTAFPK